MKHGPHQTKIKVAGVKSIEYYEKCELGLGCERRNKTTEKRRLKLDMFLSVFKLPKTSIFDCLWHLGCDFSIEVYSFEQISEQSLTKMLDLRLSCKRELT